MVVGLGQACVDYLGTHTSYPREDEKAELSGLQMQCGGPASTAIVTLSRLGVRTAFLGAVSDDAFGKKILRNLRKEKVNVSSVKISPGYSSQFAFIAVDMRDGKRTIFWYRGSVPHLKREDVNLTKFSRARFLHVDCLMIEAAIEAASQAQGLGLKVVMDGGTFRVGSEKLVGMVDFLIASETFATPLVGPGGSREEALRALRDLGAGEVVITMGAKGSVGLKNGRVVHQEAFPVQALDTTGAGDVYHGAYIYGLLQSWDMPRCMRFASATAALKCGKIGAQNGIPNLEMINGFMKAL